MLMDRNMLPEPSDLSNTAVTSVATLAALPRLQSLYLGGSSVADAERLLTRSAVRMVQVCAP
jgi:hypothetical protein